MNNGARSPLRKPGRVVFAAAFGLTMMLGVRPAPAQPQLPTAASDVAIPGFWDPRRRPERPDLSRVTLIRFLTEIDYPPFNYVGPDGSPAGFNIDLARMICEELKIACTIQMRRFLRFCAARAGLPAAPRILRVRRRRS